MDKDKTLALTERELKEIHLAMVYDEKFRHGTAGHNGYLVLAKLAMSVGFNLTEDDRLNMPAHVAILDESKRG